MDRSFRTIKREGADAFVLTTGRVYPQGRAAVWAAFTSAERLARWFMPVEGELRLGGRYQFQGNAGGVVEACEPEARIAVTWEMMGAVSWVELTFVSEGEGTRLTLRHTAKNADLPPGFWDQYGPGAVGVGWELGFYGLELHLANPDAAKPPEADPAWMASAEARAMVTASAEGWAAAAIAGGEDAAVMRATVPALIAFYTGTPA